MQKDDGRVVSNFINQVLTGEPLTVFGSGNQTRSFCYISDLVAGVGRVALKPGLGGEVFNLGNPAEFRVIDLAKKVRRLTGSKSRIVFKPLPKDDPQKRRPDITKAREVLGWEPKVSIEEGLKKTIDYYRSL